jgi:predicted phage terminase large subunit-like protein
MPLNAGEESGQICPVCDLFHDISDFHAPNDHVCDGCKDDGCEIPPPTTQFLEKKRSLKQQAKQLEVMEVELASRMLARRRFLHYVQKFDPKYTAGWVHQDIARRLERFMRDVADKKSPRLLLCMPPRHGKSQLTSRNFPSWILGHHPEWEIIAASHTQSLAMSFSRYIRDRVRDPAYQAIFPDCKLDPDSQSVENWNTTAGGGYLAAGVGTGITGRGAHVGIIDDPVKDMEAADSETIRENTWEWYLSTFYTRLAPGAGVLGILTLWNEDDWGGRIIQQNEFDDGDKFEIVRYPAINEGYDEYVDPDDHIVKIYPGEAPPEGATLTRAANSALHETRYGIEYLTKLKKAYYATGKQRIWHALYQQAPAPEDGLFFTKDMIRYGDYEKRVSFNVYQAWDFAITEKQQSDWTACTTLWQTPEGQLIVAEVRRFKSNDGENIVDRILDAYEEHRPNFVGFEDGQIFKSIRSTFTRRCQERGLYPAYDILVPLTDKFVRAGPLKGLMQSGRVIIQADRSWTQDFVDELLKFGAAKHDDMVDSTSWCARVALQHVPQRERNLIQRHKSWKDKLTGNNASVSHMAA